MSVLAASLLSVFSPMASKKDEVPERAIVPNVSVRSSALNPMPVSMISIVFFFSSTLIEISSSLLLRS